MSEQRCYPAAEALAHTGAQLRIGRVVTKTPDGELRYTAMVGDGAVTYHDGIDDVDITLTDTYPNEQALLAGDADPNALFMRGQTKVTGPTGQIVALLAATKGEAYDAAREACWSERNAR